MTHKLAYLTTFLVFMGYCLSVLSLEQHEHAPFYPETDCIAAGISFAHYGTRMGRVNGTPYGMLRTPGSKPQDAIRQILEDKLPAGDVLPTTTDGNGIGCPIFASLSFALFGVDLKSLNYGMLFLVGLSTLAFALRFPGRQLIAIQLSQIALTIMLLTPLTSSDSVVGQVSIGGLRYFFVIGIIPGIHLFHELLYFWKRRTTGGRAIMLAGLQMLILVLAIYVRGTPAYLLWPVWCGLVLVSWANPRDAVRKRLVFRFGAVIVGLYVASKLFWVALMPFSYVRTGQLNGGFWHRVFISQSAHPKWVYPGLAEQYDCTHLFKEGLHQHGGDRNGHCVWVSLPQNRNRSEHEAGRELFHAEYERQLRNAFFYVVREFPKETCEAFFYYKPQHIIPTLKEALNIDVEVPRDRIPYYILLQAIACMALVVAQLRRDVWRDALTVTVLHAGYFLCALVPHIIAWTRIHTAVDLIYFMYAIFVSAVPLLLAMVCRAWSAKERAWHS
ncbi:MraY-like glycosyltransferase [Phycisphaerae bacterium RAS1]|nr:MraY-like glycosyltransferase [Phycisphaerae bacterium RAS1]